MTLPPPCGLLRLVLDVLEQRERLAVQQQQELSQVGAPEGQAGLQQEHLEERGSSLNYSVQHIKLFLFVWQQLLLPALYNRSGRCCHGD